MATTYFNEDGIHIRFDMDDNGNIIRVSWTPEESGFFDIADHRPYDIIRKEKDDIEYPHTCFRCNKVLLFHELVQRNGSIPIELLQKWWRSDIVEFYCCHCYCYEDIEEFSYE